MTHHRRGSGILARLFVGLTAGAVVFAGANWVAAQSQTPPREKLKQKMVEKIKEQRDSKPAPQKKPQATRPASRSSDMANPLAAAIKPSEIDSLLEKELEKAGRELSPITKDEDFLRRVHIDLTGKPPTPDKLDEFVKNTDAAKRSKVIDELINTDDYARNWARYWRDVIGYHAINQQRFGLGVKNFEDWMTEQLAKNVHWDKVATELITAKGDVREDGRTYLIFAQNENNTPNLPVNLASEATRVFMGIQIACAQCHDHPYDEWKREQFHEIAAFFARTVVQRTDQNDPGSFAVKSTDELARNRGPLPKAAVTKVGGRFSMEHQMPDKEDPEKKHTMHPQFLLGQTPAQGLPDVERREIFAQYLTDKSDPWFARAYVNRIWGELMGEGFYEPVDDLGPGREARFPMIVNRLASAWRASDYDVKWLFRLIMNTEAYQREIRPRDPSSESTPFAAVCPTRLSADQIFDSLAIALGIDESAAQRGLPAGPQARRLGPTGPRGAVNAQFGVDPSTPTDDVQGTIPQALFMMNSPLLAGQIRAQGDTILGRLISVFDSDEELVRLLYKRVLARVPTDGEMKTCLEYVKEVNNRAEAFEDLLWSLVNSTEFITKR